MNEFPLSVTNISDEEKVRRLVRCKFAVGSPDKRFVHQLDDMRRAGKLTLTPAQEAYLDRCFHRYRRQLEGKK